MPNTTLNLPEITAEEVASLLITPLETASVVLDQMPQGRIIDNSTAQPLRISGFADFGGPAPFVGESQPIPDTNEAAGQDIVLLPAELKGPKVIHRVSNETVRHAVHPVASILQAALVRKVAKAADDVLLNGDGATDAQGFKLPVGVRNQLGTQSHPSWTPGTEQFVDDVIDAMALLIGADIEDSASWSLLVNNNDFRDMLKVEEGTTSARKLLEPDPTVPGRRRVQGIPVRVSKKMPAGEAALVDWSMVVIGRDINAKVTLLTERYAEFDELGIRVVGPRLDLGLLHPEGVVLMETPAP